MGNIDIYLDTFPSTGFVELADALWAGVPVVTLASAEGEDMAEAILIAGGHAEYIARNAEQYVGYAEHAANTVLDDNKWRSNMHAKVRKSELFNPEVWGRKFFESIQSIARPKLPAKKKKATAARKSS